MKRNKLRKVYKFIKTKVSIADLRPGDIFCIAPVDDEDSQYVNEEEYFMVSLDGHPKPLEGGIPGQFEIRGNRLYFQENETERED